MSKNTQLSQLANGISVTAGQVKLPTYLAQTSWIGTAVANLAVDSAGNVLTVSTSGGTTINGTGFVKASGTTISYDNSTYLTTTSAASTYLALSGGTLTGGLSGTTATLSTSLQAVRIGVNVAPISDRLLYVSASLPTTGTSQYQAVINGTIVNAVTNGYGIYTATGTNVNATNIYSLYIDAISGTGTVTNKYGVYQAASSDKNYFAGSTGIGTTSPAGKFHTVLPAYTNEDADANHAIFGSGTSGYGIKLGYSETGNSGYINVLKSGVAWSTLYIQTGAAVFNIAGSERARVNSSGLTVSNTSSGVNTGVITRDITAARTSNTGVIYLGSDGTRYLYYDSANYQLPGSNLYINGSLTLHAGNYNSYALPLTGGTLTGALQMNSLFTQNSSATSEIGGGMRMISHTKRNVGATKFIKINAGTNNYFTGYIFGMNFDDYPVGSATSTGSGSSYQFGGYSDGSGAHGDKYMDLMHFGGNNVGSFNREMNTDGNGYIITATTSTGAGGFKASATIMLFARDMSKVTITYY